MQSPFFLFYLRLRGSVFEMWSLVNNKPRSWGFWQNGFVWKNASILSTALDLELLIVKSSLSGTKPPLTNYLHPSSFVECCLLNCHRIIPIVALFHTYNYHIYSKIVVHLYTLICLQANVDVNMNIFLLLQDSKQLSFR